MCFLAWAQRFASDIHYVLLGTERSRTFQRRFWMLQLQSQETRLEVLLLLFSNLKTPPPLDPDSMPL